MRRRTFRREPTTAAGRCNEVDGSKEAGYDGWFSVHQPLRHGQTVPLAAGEPVRVFPRLI
jgi:hypothetical protein